jgi:hypothetical protein
MGLNWLCHRFPKTMSVILFIVNVPLSGRRALSYDPFPQRDLGWSSRACSL